MGLNIVLHLHSFVQNVAVSILIVDSKQISIDKWNKEHDQALWIEIIAGNRKAFETLYKHYFKALVNYGFKISQNQNLTEDAIQEVFIHIWNKKSSLPQVTEVKFYLFKSIKNKILRNLEKEDSDKLENIDFYLDFLISISEEEKKIAQENSDKKLETLQKAIAHLPLRQQEVINLKYFHDFTLDEIASLMEVNKQSVSNLLHRSYATLRTMLRNITVSIFILKLFWFW